MKRMSDSAYGWMVFLIIAMPIVIGATIGALTYTPPTHHHGAAATVYTAYTLNPIGG